MYTHPPASIHLSTHTYTSTHVFHINMQWRRSCSCRLVPLIKSNDIVDEGVATVVLYRLTIVAQAVTMLESTVYQLLLIKRALSGIHIYVYFTGIHALYLIVPLNHILYTVIDLCSYKYIMSCITVLVQGLTAIQYI